jgi:outer membrane cobalamin receptor
VPLEDIDRIEVMRGPGGTVWGANAVNGIINIIAKSSLDTQGLLVSAGTVSQDSAQGLIRYGGKAGTKGSYRAYARTSTSQIRLPGMDALPPMAGVHCREVSDPIGPSRPAIR